VRCRRLNKLTFFLWLLRSVYQAAVIFIIILIGAGLWNPHGAWVSRRTPRWEKETAVGHPCVV